MVTAVPYASAKSEYEENQILYAASFIFGLITCAYQLSRAYALHFDTTFIVELLQMCTNSNQIFKSTVNDEKAVKQAMARKLANMIKHALDINKTKDKDSLLNSHYGQALKHYETAGKRTQTAGGLLWCWRHLLGKNELLQKDGIWIPARMISANLTQYVVAIYLLIGGFFLTARVADEYDAEWAKEYVYIHLFRPFEAGPNHQTVDEGVANLTQQMASYLSNCTNFNSTKDEPLCLLLNSSFDVSSPLELFDEDALRQTLLEVAKESAYDSVDSLYPS